MNWLASLPRASSLTEMALRDGPLMARVAINRRDPPLLFQLRMLVFQRFDVGRRDFRASAESADFPSASCERQPELPAARPPLARCAFADDGERQQMAQRRQAFARTRGID